MLVGLHWVVGGVGAVGGAVGMGRARAYCLVAVILFTGCLCSVQADQSDPALAQLYTDLKQAQNPAVAAEIESEIWQLWLQAPDEDATAMLLQTTNALRQSDYREALIASTALTKAYPEYAEGWNKRATIYYLMGNFDQSVADIYETLKREPRHFGAISGLGLIFQRQGNTEDALAAFEQVLAISPQSISARMNAEQLRNELGNEI